MPRYNDMIDRLLTLSVHDPLTGCWEWLGVRDRDGYGQLSVYVPGVGTRRRFAHRTSYETFIGPIPPGLELDHICSVRACIHPNHIQPVTHAENLALRWKRFYASYGIEETT